MDKKTALKIARSYVNFLIAHQYKVRKAFLFGSYAKNKFNENSDIDVALVLDGYKDNIVELSNLMKIRRSCDLRIEPHPINKNDFNKNNPFIESIKKGLRVL